MPMTSIKFLNRRTVAGAATGLAACLLAAGCGGSSHASANQLGAAKTSTTTSTSSTTVTPPPSSGMVLAATVVQQMAKAQAILKNVKARCPSGHLTSYPVTCHFTATEHVPKFKKTYHMVGTITVSGGKPGHYSYGLNYAPTH